MNSTKLKDTLNHSIKRMTGSGVIEEIITRILLKRRRWRVGKEDLMQPITGRHNGVSRNDSAAPGNTSKRLRVVMVRMQAVLLMTALILGACTQSADITNSTPLTIQETVETTAPTPLMTQTPQETTAPSPATEETVDLRIFVVDWILAAESSAGDREREIIPLRMWMPRYDGWVGEGWALMKRGPIPPTGAGITFDRPLILFSDRCTWDDPDGEIEIDYTLEDFIDALIENPQYSASNVRDITVSGFAGKELDILSVPDGFDLTQCSGGIRPDGQPMRHMHRPWPGRYWMGRTQTSRIRVIDVNGERVVIHAMYFYATPENDIDEIFDMLDSLNIETEE
jgi:hypothetical protein